MAIAISSHPIRLLLTAANGKRKHGLSPIPGVKMKLDFRNIQVPRPYIWTRGWMWQTGERTPPGSTITTREMRHSSRGFRVCRSV